MLWLPGFGGGVALPGAGFAGPGRDDCIRGSTIVDSADGPGLGRGLGRLAGAAGALDPLDPPELPEPPDAAGRLAPPAGTGRRGASTAPITGAFTCSNCCRAAVISPLRVLPASATTMTASTYRPRACASTANVGCAVSITTWSKRADSSCRISSSPATGSSTSASRSPGTSTRS